MAAAGAAIERGRIGIVDRSCAMARQYHKPCGIGLQPGQSEQDRA